MFELSKKEFVHYYKRWCSKKFLHKVRRHLIPRALRFPRYVNGKKLVTLAKGSSIVESLLDSREPFMVTRLGATEAHMMYYCHLYLYGFEKQVNPKILEVAKINSGIFPETQENAISFTKRYLDDASSADVLAVWGQFFEEPLLCHFKKKMVAVPFKSLFPGINEWTRALKGKRVLIVHPFAKSISTQLRAEKKRLIYPDSDLLPDFEYIYYKPVVSFAAEKPLFDKWEDALERMISDIDEIKENFDVALLACGSYGLPLAAAIKRMGKQAIHVGGSLQLLFGIKGTAFDATPEVAALYNSAWIYPLDEDVPSGAEKVENACYWKPTSQANNR